MQPHLLTDFETQKYYQNDAQMSLNKESKFNGVYSRNYLPKIKDRVILTNLDEYKSIGTLNIFIC